MLQPEPQPSRHTADRERRKYEKMWTEIPNYRTNSPGEKLVAQFLKLAQWEKGDTLIDVGCGTGRAGKRLSEAGFDVTLTDITKTALDPGIELPFIECCFWDVQTWWDIFDWVYCTDVLEHIPTEQVDNFLDNLRDMSGYGAFMQIALFPDGFGQRIGQTLHLTVKPADWWLEKLIKRWHVKSWTVEQGSYLIVLTGEVR